MSATADHAGNLLADDKARYSYDAFNRTTQVETFDGNIQVNRYDAEGLRHEMEENGSLVQFIFNQDREVIAEQNSLGITRYIRSSELIARNTDAARTYYHYVSDEMGSTTHIVDEDGIVLNHYDYDAWGNLTAQEEAVPNRFKFTGQQLDPVTQQYYLRARFYNPVIARFTQEDTYRGDGLNLYAYCQNNPVFYADPSGNIASCLKEAYHAKLEQLSQEYVTDSMSAEEKTAALQRAKKDAYQAAKETYKKNHVDKNSRPDVSVPSDRSMTRAEWDKAYQAARGQGKERYTQDFADLARYRHEQGMPIAGSKNDQDTAAKLIVDENNVYYGHNGGRTRNDVLTQFKRANAITPTHAEGDVLYQARLDIGTGKNATLVVDRYPCKACGYYGGIRSLAKQMEIESITVVTPSTPPITFNPQSRPQPNPFIKQK